MDDVAGKDDECEETKRAKTKVLAQPVILNILKLTTGVYRRWQPKED